MVILEVFSETYRRIFYCEVLVFDVEDIVIDVCVELFFVGMEIVVGGGGLK